MIPDEGYVAALAGVEGMNLHRLGALLRHHPPAEAWEVVCGRAPARGPIANVLAQGGVRAGLIAAAARRDPQEVWNLCLHLGVRVIPCGHDDYPALLVHDPLPPPVLFAQGDLALLAGRRVAMVGTRNATAAGRQTAKVLGHDLGAAGVHVVSGLARGIDGCAHRGVLSAEGQGRPIGVVASGHDVIYPREHRDLWEAVANCGLLLSEGPPGTAPQGFRFPLRNRIIAALAEVVVVVESRERGGSLLTADDALSRGVPVMAVPGPVGRRAGAGTNQLLRDGAAPVTEADDVLAQLAFQHDRAPTTNVDLRVRPRSGDMAAYRLLQREPRTLDGVALAVGGGLMAVAMSLARLEAGGWIAQADGWFECVGFPLP